MKQTVEFNGLVLAIEAPEAPETPYVGDWYPKVSVTMTAPGLVANTKIEPAKALELAMVLRMAVNATRFK